MFFLILFCCWDWDRVRGESSKVRIPLTKTTNVITLIDDHNFNIPRISPCSTACTLLVDRPILLQRPSVPRFLYPSIFIASVKTILLSAILPPSQEDDPLTIQVEQIKFRLFCEEVSSAEIAITQMGKWGGQVFKSTKQRKI